MNRPFYVHTPRNCYGEHVRTALYEIRSSATPGVIERIGHRPYWHPFPTLQESQEELRVAEARAAALNRQWQEEHLDYEI